MYLSFYNLRINPFQISTNPEFLWLGEKHKEALATLRYGILDNKGFLLLTGDVGTGKTTLINALLKSLDDDILAVTVSDPGLDKLDLYYYIANIFGIKDPFTTKGQFLVIFTKFLHDMHDNGKKVLLIIDESQRLTAELLEEIRLLSNIEKPDTKLINIFFVGQNEFNALLNKEENRAIRQRITASYDIAPLSIAETGFYISHRLKIAGSEQSLFTPSAIEQIYVYSRGYPRLINVISDRALLTGFVEESKEIGPKIVLECANELRIPESTRRPGSGRPVVQRMQQPAKAQIGQGTKKQNITLQAVQQENIPPSQGARKQVKAETPKVQSLQSIQPVYKEENRVIGAWLVSFVILFAAVASLAYYFFPEKIDQGLRIFNQQAGQSAPAMATYQEGSIARKQIKSTSTNSILPERSLGGQKKVNDVRQGDLPIILPETPEEPQNPSDSHVKIIDSVFNSIPELSGEPKPGEINARNRMVKKSFQPTQITAEKKINEITSPELIEQQQQKLDETILTRKQIIQFGYDSNTLSRQGADILDTLALHLNNFPYSELIINGYSDNLGSDHYNKRLSLFRANLVKTYLMGRGINPDQLIANGLGDADPVASNETLEGRMANRRVEVEVSR